MLKTAPGLYAAVVFEEMQRRHPDPSAGIRLDHRLCDFRLAYSASHPRRRKPCRFDRGAAKAL